jgi:hypothetical protein
MKTPQKMVGVFPHQNDFPHDFPMKTLQNVLLSGSPLFSPHQLPGSQPWSNQGQAMMRPGRNLQWI